MERGKILDDAKQIINGERQDVYGNPENSFGLIADFWSSYLMAKGKLTKSITDHDVAMMMSLMKDARICLGSGKRDSYTDAAGYIAIAADMAEVMFND